MKRIIAVDYGTKRVGLAVTDPLQIIAGPLDTVHAKDVIEYLKKYCAQNPTESFVVGMPVRLDNTATNNTSHVRGFVRILQRTFPDIPVFTTDERFTSVIASQAMLDGGLGKKARANKATVDMVSAVIILQSFMQQRSLFAKYQQQDENTETNTL
ncbi:putative holliday junction resolvase [Flexibacter flexilis DSM 6793]|uniref:Putative pre-16S rRNA nuclease n=1 Tax=Flexibacter flexilis DSM 6793 TaxID=927664 RepID=A0A1I1HY79_9BACT|nr:Holliday junction resolvase RuvX [Flexibacter flexilis]SFC28791.1 putative holliday junction resolvase [Flexibacter flexilis DSM 6793]